MRPRFGVQNVIDSPGGGGNYQLRMATNGNLPIDRNDNIGEFIWLTGTQKDWGRKDWYKWRYVSKWMPLMCMADALARLAMKLLL